MGAVGNQVSSTDLERGETWASDIIAAQVRHLGFDVVALNPGASFRGLHDSFVNYGGAGAPEMLVCLHDEHAVAIAHGYAKVSGRPMLVALHANVGLMHATMAIFNAWCDRVPMVILGANGPADAMLRRPWIDWLHATADQAAPIREFTKWDDTPGSLTATVESIVRATALSQALPSAPTYVSLDVAMQESVVGEVDRPALIKPVRFADPVPDGDTVQAIVSDLQAAQRPIIMIGRGDVAESAWRARIALAEATGARIVADERAGSRFPTGHPLFLGWTGIATGERVRQALQKSDCLVALDPIDLVGSIGTTSHQPPWPDSQVAYCITPDPYVHRGWSKDYQALPAFAQVVLGDPDGAVAAMCAILGSSEPTSVRQDESESAPQPGSQGNATPGARAGEASGHLTLADIAGVLAEHFADIPTTFTRFPLNWPTGVMSFDHRLGYIGHDGGAGIGSGPGMAVGAAIALRGSGRIPVAVLGDGDFIMGSSALWTAAAAHVGLLVIVANNRGYGNDAAHQQYIAEVRDRPVENRWVGQQIDEPTVDVAQLARSYGATAASSVKTRQELQVALRDAVDQVASQHIVVIDVRTRE